MSEEVPSSSSCVHSDTVTEMDLLAQTDNIVLVNSPPDYVKQISRHLTSCVEQQREQDTNSDSGESLFITQKCAPERRRRSKQRTHFRTHIDAPQHEYVTSASEEELEADRKRRKKSYQTPKFSFPFLKKRLIRLPYYQNRKLHYYAMGGYFRCAEQLWESYQTGEGLLASLPTVDVDGEPISPISEEEDETIKDEHIRVVEKKLFVASIAKSSQPWYNPGKRADEEMQQNHERTNGACKISTWRPLPKGTQSSKKKESDKILEEAESSDKSVTKSGNFTAETGMGMTDRSPKKGSRASGFPAREKGKMLDNIIDAKCRGLIAEQCTGVDKQTCLGDSEDTECHRIKVKKRKKKKQKDRGGDNCVEEGKGQPADPSRSPVITEAADGAAKKKKHEDLGQAAHGQSEEDSVLSYEAQIGGKKRRKKNKRNDDTDSVTTSKVAQSTTKDGLILKKKKRREIDRLDSHQTPTEHPETIDHSANGKTSQETLESTGLKRKKHKKKKKQSLSNDHLTDVNFSNSAMTLAENTDFVRMKKVSEVAKLSEESQTEKQEVEPASRKKKKIKDDTSRIYPEDMLTSCDYSELGRKKNKRRNPSFLCADDEEQLASAREGRAEKHEVGAGESAADSADVSEHSLEPRGGKEKKKRSAAVPESEEREPEETAEAGVRKKKKRKRTESLPGSLESIADEGRSQTEEAVVVRKKKKKKKDTQEVLPAATEHPAAEKTTPDACSSLPANQKLLMEHEGKRKGGAVTSCDNSLSTLQQAKKTLTEGASDLHASGDVSERKKKKSTGRNAPEGKPCTHTTNTEARKTKTADGTKRPADPRFTSTSPKRSPAEMETSSSQCVMGKRVRAKRRLHNPDTDFLSDL